jgi:hypothetical protein
VRRGRDLEEERENRRYRIHGKTNMGKTEKGKGRRERMRKK